MKTRIFIFLMGSALILLLTASCGQKQQRSTAGVDATAQVNATAENTENLAGGEETAAGDDENKGKPLGVKSGIIEYSYSGDKTGKSTQYFDDYGLKSAVYADIVQQGESSNGWSLTLGEDQYMWDPSKPGQGIKAKNPMAASLSGKSAAEIESLTASMYEQMGMAKSGTEMFQGKECTVYKGDMGRVLLWKGLLMMMEMKIGEGVARQEVTSIKINIHVDGKYFKIPDNVTFSEIPGF